MTKEEAATCLEALIGDESTEEAQALAFLLGEIRDLTLERNKHELDAAHWKERYEDAVRSLDMIDTINGRAR